jgi:glycosyltransferase involved in cell wall biosynthesis
MVLTRAFASALPAVASDIPGYREVLDPAASIAVAPDDPAALAQAIETLVADEPRRRAMGEAARAIAVERYSWSVIARRLEEIYERVTRVERGLRAA